MAINKAFLGHSLYAELGIGEALDRYAYYGVPANSPRPTDAQRVERFVQALKDMEIQTLWLQLFSRGNSLFDTAEPNKTNRQMLFDLLAREGINWVGWGYCAGTQCARNKQWIAQLKNDLKNLTTFVLDVEPGNDITDPITKKKIKDVWSVDDFADLVGHVNSLFGTANTGVTTWPILSVWEPKYKASTMMKTVAGQVSVFNPQVYWLTKPPVKYVLDSIKSWRDANFNNPLVVTGSVYWEGSATEQNMDAKVDTFLTEFADWNKIAGYGWYHAGMKNKPAGGSMSDAMIASIKRAKLGQKPYQGMAPAAV